MAFNSTLDINGSVATISLVGELDAAATPGFKENIEKAAAAHISKLVLQLGQLSYMSSAGLRALIFAKQKAGPGVEIVMVAVQDSVRETLEMTGFHHSVTLVDAYDGDETLP